MRQIYDIELENRLYDNTMEIAELQFELWKIAAEQLGITVDEYCDFIQDMDIETTDYTLDEIEGMYAEYCREYDIPCMQIDIGIPMKLYGAI